MLCDVAQDATQINTVRTCDREPLDPAPANAHIRAGKAAQLFQLRASDPIRWGIYV